MTQPQYPKPGVYTPSPTFFKTEDSARPQADVATQVKHTKFLADNGVDGVVLLGSTGEMIHMTRKERVDFIAGVQKGLENEGLGDYPIIAGVAQHGIEDTLVDISEYKKAGAKWAMVLAPNYFAPSTTQKGLIKWFNAVADESELPVLIYYFPGVSNNIKMTPETFETLSKHENIVGCKMSHGDCNQYTQVSLNPEIQKQNFTCMTGLGQLLLPAMSVGIDGTIDAMSGIFPKTLKKLFTLAQKGEVTKEVQSIQYTVSRVEEIVAAFGPIGIKYTVKKVLGMGENDYGRAPLSEALTAEQTAPFEQAIQNAIKLENSL